MKAIQASEYIREKQLYSYIFSEAKIRPGNKGEGATVSFTPIYVTTISIEERGPTAHEKALA
jgi:hypothetical protein